MQVNPSCMGAVFPAQGSLILEFDKKLHAFYSTEGASNSAQDGAACVAHGILDERISSRISITKANGLFSSLGKQPVFNITVAFYAPQCYNIRGAFCVGVLPPTADGCLPLPGGDAHGYIC